jgi:hypothetical protein
MGFRISELAIIFVYKFIVINIEIGLKQNVPTQAIPEQMENFIAFVREVQFLIEEVKEVNNLEG